MNTHKSIDELMNLAKCYLDDRASGKELVRSVDDLVAAGYDQEVNKGIRALIDNFQDQLALYVPDERTRQEASEVYFGDDQLRFKVKHFLNEVTKICEITP